MILQGYGISLHRLEESDIEFLRLKRNLPEIRSFMIFRDEISAEDQLKWFHSINNEKNNYFIIHYEGKRIGMISGAEIDWNEMITGNGGLFIWEAEFWGTGVPYFASVLLTELSFLIGFRKSYVKVLKSNARAISFNRELGYEITEMSGNPDVQTYVLDAETFFTKTESLRSKLAGNGGGLKCVLTQPFDPMSQKVFDAIQRASPENRKRFELIINTR